jgi:hypothetical protein
LFRRLPALSRQRTGANDYARRATRSPPHPSLGLRSNGLVVRTSTASAAARAGFTIGCITGVLTLAVASFLAAFGPLGVSVAHADPVAVQSELTPVVGQGTGKVIISPTAADGHDNFFAQAKVNIHDTTPNTTFTVTRTTDPVRSRRHLHRDSVRLCHHAAHL